MKSRKEYPLGRCVLGECRKISWGTRISVVSSASMQPKSIDLGVNALRSPLESSSRGCLPIVGLGLSLGMFRNFGNLRTLSETTPTTSDLTFFGLSFSFSPSK